MTLILVIWFATGALAGTLFGNHHQQLDPLRCYAERSYTYWDGEDGARRHGQATRSILHCWPKNGCWLASNGDAICWRVVKVKHP